MPESRSEELNRIWEGVRDDLRPTLSKHAFEQWLEPLRVVGGQGTRLYISGPVRVRDWFTRRYSTAASDALRRRAPEFQEVVFTDAARVEESPDDPPLGIGAGSELPAGLVDDLSFDRFVIGSGNRFAHSSALAVAESPGEAYNPLFIYGSPGLGKTHLLVSIANYLRRQRPDISVVYTTAERFTSEFVTSLRTGGGGGARRFKEHYRGVGALLIDDVQFLEGKAKTEDEFFHTFNELYAAGSQIVLSSDRPPEAMGRLSERMRDRFAWGLTVRVEGPDLATRIALLKRLAVEHSIPPPGADVLRQIAAAAPANLRQLEGALTRVVAFASLYGEAPTTPLVRRALGITEDDGGVASTGSPPPAPIDPQRSAGPAEEQLERIQHAVCDVLHLAISEMRSKRRTPNSVRGRQLAMHVARSRTELSLAEIARGFDRDHSTGPSFDPLDRPPPRARQ